MYAIKSIKIQSNIRVGRTVIRIREGKYRSSVERRLIETATQTLYIDTHTKRDSERGAHANTKNIIQIDGVAEMPSTAATNGNIGGSQCGRRSEGACGAILSKLAPMMLFALLSMGGCFMPCIYRLFLYYLMCVYIRCYFFVLLFFYLFGCWCCRSVETKRGGAVDNVLEVTIDDASPKRS